ncbi:LysR family transcriptional regulator [Robertmurraya massiliosenegalensis]|uniref:LysR family transcriptional regulator n=1 Tax=Robertmurraya TaxID=2837507 RepID=UPI0039A6DADD
MQIHQLEYVIALEKYRHFSLAANEINVSQSTLSDQIRKLEKELGIELFVRTTRKVALSSAGEDFLIYAKRILAEIDKAKQTMIEHQNLSKGRIRIGAISTITHLGITAIIANFQKEYPGINIEILEANSDKLFEKFQTSEIDVAFITYPYISDIDFDFYPVTDDELVVIVGNEHPLAKREKVSFSELVGEKFLLIKASKGLQNTLIQACHEAGFNPNIILESYHSETICGLVEGGMGISFFSARLARSLLNTNSQFSIVSLNTSIRRITGLAIPKQNHLLSAKTFRDFVLQHPI